MAVSMSSLLPVGGVLSGPSANSTGFTGLLYRVPVSRHSRKAFADEARERRIVVRCTSAIVDVAKAPEF